MLKIFQIHNRIRFAGLLLMASLSMMTSNRLAASPKHEMRGLWVATVYGIDWPSTQGATQAVADAQKKEFIALLDMAANAHFNAVFLQVRPMADALYKSSLEPWSSYLTGGRGRAPISGWDPLAFAVKEAHARGLELHAWVNPFRFSTSLSLPQTAADQKAVANHWVLTQKKTVGGKTKAVSILDPGNPDARQHIVAVCKEIITNYDVDGLVFDDYFYPEKFPIPADEDPQEVGDQRRENVAKAIAEVNAMVNAEKPWVRFGVAPAGVAGGNGKATAQYGLTPPSVGNDWMYNDIFCDPLRWLADGSVDYVSPQVYWPLNHSTNPYEPLVNWWAEIARHFKRHLYVSQNVPSLPAGDAAWKEQRQEVVAQRKAAAKYNVPAGQVFYSAAHLTGKKAKGLAGELLRHEYADMALMPTMTWKQSAHQDKVQGLKLADNALSWFDRAQGRYVCYAIPYSVDPIDALSADGVNFDSKYIIGVSYTNRFTLPLRSFSGYWFAVAPYDRYGNEGEATTLNAPNI
jgi:uncharacterized lipoprotein YddW (UPF0748 family)